jgi:hypothetical protein
MVLSVGCTLADDVLSPTAKFTFKIVENSDLCQQLVDVGIRVIPDVPIGERTATSKGNHVWQLKKGGCRDYTHLSIALCRALTIPARHVGGSAVRLDRWMFMWVPKLTSAGNDICWIRPTVSHPTGSRWSPAVATRPGPHSRRFSTRLTRSPSRFRVFWRDRGRVGVCRRADGFGSRPGSFLPNFYSWLRK